MTSWPLSSDISVWWKTTLASLTVLLTLPRSSFQDNPYPEKWREIEREQIELEYLILNNESNEYLYVFSAHFAGPKIADHHGTGNNICANHSTDRTVFDRRCFAIVFAVQSAWCPSNADWAPRWIDPNHKCWYSARFTAVHTFGESWMPCICWHERSGRLVAGKIASWLDENARKFLCTCVRVDCAVTIGCDPWRYSKRGHRSDGCSLERQRTR